MTSSLTLSRVLGTAFAGMTGLAIAAGSAGAVDFKGKTIELIVPYGAGGGSTIHARVLAPMYEKALPGNPKILIKNIDGGGSVKGINYYAQHAKPDGMMIASLGTGTFFKYILRDKAVNYDLPKFIPFLTSPFGMVIYGRTDFGLKGDPIADVKFLASKKPTYGGSGAKSSDLPALYSIDLLNVKLNTVFGLSNKESQQAIQRGEIQINYDNMASWAKNVKPMVDKGIVKPLFTMGFENESGKIVRDPALADMITFPEMYKAVHGKELAGPEYKVWKSLFNIRVMGSKMLALAPGTPKAIIDVYVDATKKVLASPEMNGAAAKKVFGEYPQSTGEASVRILKEAAELSDDEFKLLTSWLLKVHNAK
ncbi:MAG: hypothetical protein RLZ98_11 [Pseudomonadota bacterium]|jgi:tripartite-type tricarboxylate transporter receptor subunit TctC